MDENALSGVLKMIGKEGTFAVGVVAGCLMNHFAHKLASSERRGQQAADAEREKELLAQLALKDERIERLHQRLGKKK